MLDDIVDFPPVTVDDDWLMNAAVWYTVMDKDVVFSAAIAEVKVDVEIQPWVYMMSVSNRDQRLSGEVVDQRGRGSNPRWESISYKLLVSCYRPSPFCVVTVFRARAMPTFLNGLKCAICLTSR